MKLPPGSFSLAPAFWRAVRVTVLVFSLAATARAGGIPFQSALDAAAVNEADVSNISTKGLVLGNGELNAIVYSSGNDLHLRVSKNDCWDMRINTSGDGTMPIVNAATQSFTSSSTPSWNYAYPTALPCTDVTLTAVAGQTGWTSAKLDLAKANAAVASNADTTTVRVLSQSNVILVDSSRTVALSGISGMVKDNGGNSISSWVSAADGGIQSGYTYLHQNIPGDADASGMDIYVVTGASGSKRAIAVVTSRESATPLNDAVNLVTTTLADANAVTTHETAWQNFWAKSGVSLGDSTLQNWWYRMVYFFRCFSRSGGNAIGLQAAFDKLGGWHNSLKLNYNIQQTYLAAGPINHPELLEPFADVLSRNLNRAKWFATTNFTGSEGAFFHSDLWPFEPDPANCTTKNQHQLAYIPWGYTWGMDGHSAAVLWDYYKFNPSTASLNRIYPVLQQFALFYCSLLEKCQVVNGKIKIGPSYFPENGSYGQYNVSYDIAFINFCLKSARDAATLKGDTTLVNRINNLLPQMPTYTTVNDSTVGGTVIEEWLGSGLQSADNHGTTTQPIFPAGEITWFSSDADKALFTRTIQRVENITGHANSNVTINIGRARLGLGSFAIANAKLCFALNSAYSPEQPNGLFYWNNHGYYITEQVCIARLVSELLLQSVGDVIRIFPAWPSGTDGSFSRLLAQGGFEVSADRISDVIQNVAIKSTSGGSVSVCKPWPGYSVNVVAQSTGASIPTTSGSSIVTFSTTSGETYLLSQGALSDPPSTPTGMQASTGDALVLLNWSASIAAASYTIKRSTDGVNFASVGTATGTNYVDTGLTNGTTYTYKISASNAVGSSANSSVVTAIPSSSAQKLTGPILGTAGSWSNLGNTKEMALDGNLNTYFDAPTSIAWVGLDLGVNTTITQVRYSPRSGNGGRMVGGQFQVSSDAAFGTSTTLFTISSTPTVGVYTSQGISNASPSRYVRYLGPANGFGNVAELEFYGTRQPPAAPAGLLVNGGSNSVQLAWTDAASDEVAYQVEYSLAGANTWVSGPELPANTTSATVSGLTPGASYDFRVKAMSLGGVSSVLATSVQVGAPPSGGSTPTTRLRQNLNRDWKFKLGDYTGAEVGGYDDSFWNAVNLPHSFSLPYFLSFKFYTGYGWYRRHLTVPSDWVGKRVSIEFEGAFQDAQVYVNGTLIGRHLGGYTGFSYDISSVLMTGDNVIAVRLNNLWNAQVAPRAGDHTFSGGLYRDVSLVVSNPLHVTWYGTFVSTPTLAASAGTSSTVNVKTEIRNDNATARPCTVKTDIVDPYGATVASVSSTQTVGANTTVTFDQTTPAVANPQLWHPDHPILYHAVTTVSDGGTAVDNYDTRFGFRWFTWTAAQGFFLNGSHYYFHGVDVHQDHAGWGDGVTNAGFYRDVQMVKDAGFNFIRGSHYPKDPAFGDACDDVGVLFWSENCFWGIGGATGEGDWGTAGAYPNNTADQAPFEQSVLNTLTDMIRIHRNHPSIVAWSMSNEPFFTSTTTTLAMRNLLASEVALSHQLDPTRPAGIGGAQRPLDSTRIDMIGDIAGYNGDGATQAVFQNPGIPNMVTEYGSPYGNRPGVYDAFWGSLQLTNGFPTEYSWRSGQALWCMFDHGSVGGLGLELDGAVDYFRLPKRAWYWYRNAYRGITPPTWPVAGTAAKLGLDADKTTVSAVDGTDDALIRVSILDANGNRLSNTAPVTLTIESGPGEFPTGRTIVFTPAGNGDASDIAIADGWAAIEFRAYQSGTSVIRATSPGLTDATITITSQGSPAFVPGVTPQVASRPYIRYSGTTGALYSTQLALNRPTKASSTAPGAFAGFANDGDASTGWLAADTNPNAWWTLSLEAQYQVNRIQLTFPTPGNYRYKIDVTTDGVNFVTVVDQSQTSSTEQTRVATGNFGNAIGAIRVRFTGLPPGLPAGLSEVAVGGGFGLTFNTNQLGGTIIGTAGSFNNSGNTKEKAMDGSTASYFDAPSGDGNWVGIDLGSNASARVAKVRYCPRTGNGARMMGGKFQGANSPDFSGAVDLYTVSSSPGDGVFTSQEVTNSGSFRYLRYLAPAGSYGNVAEVEFYKYVGTGATTLYAFENDANDSSGNGNNGTPSGITYVAGKTGSFAANFNGTTAYIGSALTTAGDFSVAMWVKTTSNSSSGSSTSQWWAGKGLVDGDMNGSAADWGTSITNGKFAFGIGGTNDVTVFSSATINDNAWHHCVATWSATTGAMTVYVDGTANGSGTGGAGVSRVSPIALKLGRIASGGTTGSISLNGALDDVRYYDRVLSSTEIASLAGGTAANGAPAALSSLNAAAGDGQVTLAWSTSSGATSYLVKRSVTSGSGYALVDTTSSTSYVDTSVANGGTYYYVVAAANLAGTSANSPQASALPIGLPDAPADVTAFPGAEQNTLIWSAAANATGYTVMRGTLNGGPYTPIQAVSSTAFTDTGLTGGSTYYYVVTATNSAGTGAYSAQVAATPLTQLQAWRQANFGTTANSGDAADSADPDGDGWSNAQEFASGTNPKDRTSLLKISQVIRTGNDIVISFPTVAGKVYRVECSDTLPTGSWTVVQDSIAGTGSTVQVTDTGGTAQSRRFYRIVVH